MNEPGAAVIVAYYVRLALKPDHVAVAGKHAIAGTDGLAGHQNFGRFHVAAVFVVGMDLLIPEDRILQPFVARKSEGNLDVRADIGSPQALIEVGGEDHRRNLLHQRAVAGFDIGRGARGLRILVRRLAVAENPLRKLAEKRLLRA